MINLKQFLTPKKYLLLFLPIAIAASLWIGKYVAQGGFTLVLFVLIFVPLVLITLYSPRAALVFVILGTFTFEYLNSIGLLPTPSVWATDALVLILFSRTILDRGKLTGWFLRSREFVLLVVWIGLVAASSVVNSSSPLALLVGIRAYIRFPLMYYCLLEYDWDEKFLIRCLRLVLVFSILQIPLMLIQKARESNPDMIYGTIMGTGLVGVFSMGIFMIFFTEGFIRKSSWALVLAMAILVLPGLAVARAFVLIIPAMVVYALLRLRRHWNVWKIAGALLIIGVLIVNWDRVQGMQIYKSMPVLEVIQNPLIFLDELMATPMAGTGGQTVGRFAGIQMSWDLISQSLGRFLFGFGPATAQGSRFSSLQISLTNTLGLAGGFASQLTRSLLEWGVLGTLSYILLIISLWWRAEKSYNILQEPLWKGIALALSTYTLLMVVLSAYTATWSGTATAFLLWFMAGILQRHMLVNELSKENSVVN